MKPIPLVLCLLGYLLMPGAATASSNAGIVQGLWFETDTFFAGDTVRVYVAVRNNTAGDFSGTVEFFADEERIERNNIDALPGRLVESWADWTPDYGTSTLRATLSRTEISSSASGTEAIAVTSALAELARFVDRDTDGDTIGDNVDPDDDNDGIPDTDDASPLVFDDPTEEPSAEPEQTTERTAATKARDETTNSDPNGLEQFLTPSRADTALASLTEVINQSKEDLDAYRDRRKIPDTEPEATADEVASTSPDGFGPITRSTDPSTVTIEPDDSGSSWWQSLLSILTAIATTLYTALLSIPSFALGYPVLIQLLLICTLLYFIYRLAKRFGGRRPS